MEKRNESKSASQKDNAKQQAASKTTENEAQTPTIQDLASI